jgi:hypothetical protein
MLLFVSAVSAALLLFRRDFFPPVSLQSRVVVGAEVRGVAISAEGGVWVVAIPAAAATAS